MNSGFHVGELAVQEQAGVRAMADRVGPSVHPEMPQAAQDFLARQPMIIVGFADRAGRVWASLLTGKPGFASAFSAQTVSLDAVSLPGDPLGEVWQDGTEVGLLAIEPASRRRMRVNGRLMVGIDGGMTVAVRQAYANCPKYIQAREWEALPERSTEGRTMESERLTPAQQEWIARADTFFIATAHPDAGADASHRGGAPGFVQVRDSVTLTFVDYAGNNLFNTLGNLAVNPHAGLLFLDFDTGDTLQITGAARVVWGNKRRVEFQITSVRQTSQALPLHWRFLEASPFNL